MEQRIFSFSIKEQLPVMLQNVKEVNREPAHIEWRLVHVTLTRQTDRLAVITL